jgi:hypothetical protein
VNTTVFDLDQSDDRFGVVATIIEQEISDKPLEMKRAVAWYAGGNLGAARLIARQCKSLGTIDEVEALIGWPLFGERKEQGHELYSRFKAS